MSDLSDFVGTVVDKFAESITDYVFIMIQNDREMMQKYLRHVSDTKLDTVNQQIGRAVKDRFSLVNAPRRQDSPESTLIKSHQVFFVGDKGDG